MTRQRPSTAEVVVRAAAEVGEGPVWDHRRQQLVWVDITTGTFHRSSVGVGTDQAFNTGGLLGAVALRDGCNYVAATEDGFAEMDDRGNVTLIERTLPCAHLRMNDAKCDTRGRLWAGSTSLTFEPGRGALHRWDLDRRSMSVRQGLTLPNGLGWSPDGKTFYLIDTMAYRLYQFPFEPDEGELGSPTTLINFETGLGLPDGLCVDTDGCLWIAFFGGACIRRYDPHGELVAELATPVSQPTSCAIGPDNVLYITTARAGLTASQLAKEPHAGSVLASHVGVGGLAASAYCG